ncbi:MAG: class B sortase [Eubacteriaceae bacterium]|nr:class B sortase [Eubacteriaceae bacterium]
MDKRKILRILAILVLIISSGMIVYSLYVSASNKKMNADLKTKVEVVEKEESKQEVSGKFTELQKVNGDTAGWIKIDDTMIDYPVVRTIENEYYLAHDFYKNESKAGTIFMDYRNLGDGIDRNVILYGHNMKDGSMFKDLMKYKDRSFFDSHRFIQFDTLLEETKWEIFSVYVTGTDFYYIDTDFSTDEEYQVFLDTLQKKSLFPTDVRLTAADQILTLSTCSYEFDNARFVVQARKVPSK